MLFARRVARVLGTSSFTVRRLLNGLLLLLLLVAGYSLFGGGGGSSGGSGGGSSGHQGNAPWSDPYSDSSNLGSAPPRYAAGDKCCRLAIAIPVARKHMDRVAGWVAAYGSTDVHWVLFHYDDSGPEWMARFAWYRDPETTTQYTWRGMMKFGFFKRWLTPEWLDALEPTHLLLVDSDAGLDGFDLHRFVRTVTDRGISLAQPAVRHEQRGERSSDHVVSRLVPGSHVGRWTGFVEGGPLAVFTADAWKCVWRHMQEGLVRYDSHVPPPGVSHSRQKRVE